MRIGNFSHVCWLLMGMAPAADTHTDRGYQEQIRKWRADYEASLKQDNGWLTLAGLYWMKDGDNLFGTGVKNQIVLPPASAPENAGCFVFHEGKIRLRVNARVALLVNGAPVTAEMPLQPDSTGKPDRITLGRLSMIAIQRGSRYGIRLWDNASAVRRDFQGTHWFPLNESYRVTAKFVSYPQPKMIPILNVLGDTEPSPSPGYAEFEIGGKQCHLEPLLEGDHLFFIFKDATSGKQTYPAGRFLYAALPKDGKVTLDFNQAHNPPCAFTAYATCPLPPRQNHLTASVEAGELHAERPAR